MQHGVVATASSSLPTSNFQPLAAWPMHSPKPDHEERDFVKAEWKKKGFPSRRITVVKGRARSRHSLFSLSPQCNAVHHQALPTFDASATEKASHHRTIINEPSTGVLRDRIFGRANALVAGTFLLQAANMGASRSVVRGAPKQNSAERALNHGRDGGCTRGKSEMGSMRSGLGA